MPAIRDFLQRFRPAGAPGPAAAAVPADRRAEVEAELAPIFADLSVAERERAEVLAAGEAEASGLVAAARALAVDIVARARASESAERAAAAAVVVTAATAEQEVWAADAGRAAERIRSRAADLIPKLAERAVDRLGLPDGKRS